MDTCIHMCITNINLCEKQSKVFKKVDNCTEF